MAGDWIKFDICTSDKPEIWAIAEALNIDPDAVVGKLLRVWAWFDQHTEDGIAPISAKSMMDRLTGITGFCDAVIASDWMRDDGISLVLLGFDKHNGKTAKQRINTARRVANHKSRNAGNAESNAPLTQTHQERTCIPRPIRKLVYERDGSACVYCQRKEGEYAAGETRRDGLLSIDHVIPFTRNGSDSLDNLVTCCIPCNSYKSDRTPDEAGLSWPVNQNGKRYGSVSPSVSSALPKEEKRREDNTKKKPAPNGAVSLARFIEANQDSQGRTILITDPIFKYAEETGIPPEYLSLCWRTFVNKYSDNRKKYTDWRAVFRSAVRENWLKLWWIADDGSYQLTTAGKQAKLQQGAAA